MGERLHLRFGATSHVGRVREHNEDAYLVLPESYLAVVADGMGGHNAGDVASQLTIETLEAEFNDELPPPSRGWRGLFRRRATNGSGRLLEAVRHANRVVLETAQQRPECRGMGTTIVAAWLEAGAERLHVAHVGDSRVYRLRGGELTALTEDHSLLNEYLRLGELTPAQAKHFPYKNIIVRALGLSPGVQIDVDSTVPLRGDMYLLCSDGLTDLVDDAKIRVQLATASDLDAAADALVELALGAGGLDNVTAVVAEVEA